MFCAATSSINKHGPMMDKFTLFPQFREGNKLSLISQHIPVRARGVHVQYRTFSQRSAR